MLKTFFLFCIICFVHTAGISQIKIKPEEAASHIGDSVTICGKIFGGKFLDAAKNQPTFLNVGAAYPKQLLTIVIWGNTRKLFSYKPEEALNNKTVCVTGRIETFKDKPQIVVTNPSQLKIE